MLASPQLPGYRILVAGKPYGVPLPWPEDSRTNTGHLLLPPTMTNYGPISWVSLPDIHVLDTCREIDVFGAVHTLLLRRSDHGRPAP